jgi:GTP cyclohydrolase II
MSQMQSEVFNSWCTLPTPMGDFRMYDSGDEHLRVVCLGDLREQGRRPLLRVHSSCLASEVFGAGDCDCADQLREAMKLIATEGRGLILHLHQEGRGQGLSLKIKAVGEMQRGGLDTVEAFEALGLEQDVRCYDDAVRVLQVLGIDEVRLISNNPRKLKYLERNNIKTEMVNTHPTIRPENAEYLETKKQKLGHRLPLETESAQVQEPIHFYHSDQPWGELSNFSRHGVFLRRPYLAHRRALLPSPEVCRDAQRGADPLLGDPDAREASSA